MRTMLHAALTAVFLIYRSTKLKILNIRKRMSLPSQMFATLFGGVIDDIELGW
jgi:hypothetical protein